jgi:tetratricopeptide (TPR) repeat protein
MVEDQHGIAARVAIVIQRGIVNQGDIELTVVITIEESNSAAHLLDDVFLFGNIRAGDGNVNFAIRLSEVDGGSLAEGRKRAGTRHKGAKERVEERPGTHFAILTESLKNRFANGVFLVSRDDGIVGVDILRLKSLPQPARSGARNEWLLRLRVATAGRSRVAIVSRYLVPWVFLSSLVASGIVAQPPQLPATRLMHEGKYKEAEKLLLDSIRQNRNDSRAYEMLGTLYADEQRVDEAVAILEKGATRTPKRLKIGVNLAALYQQRGDFKKSLQTAEAIPATSRPQRLLPVMAADYFGLSRAEDAQHVVGEILRLAPKNPELVPQLAQALLQQGAVGDARELLSVAAEHQPKTASLLSASAQVQAHTGQDSDARRSLVEALTIDPNHTDALLAKAHLDGRSGDWKAAIASLKKVIAQGPPRVDVLRNLVYAGMQIDDLETAHNAAVELYDLNPNSTENALALAAVLVRASHWGEAGTLMDKVLATAPSDKRAQLVKGIAEYNLGKIESANSHLNASLGQGAADAEAHYMLGLVAKQGGDIPLATREMESALAANPRKLEALTSLGQFYLQLGEAERAKAVLERAVKAASADSQNHYQLALVYRKLGMEEKAREQMEIFQRLTVRNVPQPTGEASATQR